jgi:fumarate hydratase subunit beta
MSIHNLTIPLNIDDVRKLHIEDVVYLTGNVFTSRDMAHLRARDYIEKGIELPAPQRVQGSVLFHAGPVVIKENEDWRMVVIGPTTSMRMEPHCDLIPKFGVRAIVGKGGMGADTLKMLQEWGGVYLAAAPGCACKHAEAFKRIVSVDWLDMGMPEAVWNCEVVSWGPLLVAMDSHGKSIYEIITEKAKRISAFKG